MRRRTKSLFGSVLARGSTVLSPPVPSRTRTNQKTAFWVCWSNQGKGSSTDHHRFYRNATSKPNHPRNERHDINDYLSPHLICCHRTCFGADPATNSTTQFMFHENGGGTTLQLNAQGDSSRSIPSLDSYQISVTIHGPTPRGNHCQIPCAYHNTGSMVSATWIPLASRVVTSLCQALPRLNGTSLVSQ